MKNVKFYRTIWGLALNFSNKGNAALILKEIKNNGFDGIEIATGFFDSQYKIVLNEYLRDKDLDLITQIHTTGYPVSNHSVEDHIDDYKRKVEDAMTYNPIHINVHSGSDLFDIDANYKYFDKTNEFNKQINISISHETHRQRSLNTAYSTYQILKLLKEIPITLDLSHWIVSAERLISEETDDIYWTELKRLLHNNTKHIHARVSTTNIIQVPDPNNQLYTEYTEYFENIWADIMNNSQNRIIHITPEYGPVPYALQSLEGNNLTDTNEITNTYLKRLKARLL